MATDDEEDRWHGGHETADICRIAVEGVDSRLCVQYIVDYVYVYVCIRMEMPWLGAAQIGLGTVRRHHCCRWPPTVHVNCLWWGCQRIGAAFHNSRHRRGRRSSCFFFCHPNGDSVTESPPLFK